jgi:hypothetical protein
LDTDAPPAGTYPKAGERFLSFAFGMELHKYQQAARLSDN